MLHHEHMRVLTSLRGSDNGLPLDTHSLLIGITLQRLKGKPSSGGMQSSVWFEGKPPIAPQDTIYTWQLTKHSLGADMSHYNRPQDRQRTGGLVNRASTGTNQ